MLPLEGEAQEPKEHNEIKHIMIVWPIYSDKVYYTFHRLWLLKE